MASFRAIFFETPRWSRCTRPKSNGDAGTIVASLEVGDSVEDIPADFPLLAAENSRSAIAFAATS
jgi:hypothetical protein